jgi:2-keto-3-deoxy-L-rhamnonate aldolase RhmA
MLSESLRVKEKLRGHQCVFGTMAFEFASPGLPSILKQAEADYCIYDLEHSGFSLETIKSQVAAARGTDLLVIARPPAKQYHYVSGLLDVGIQGVLLPMVETAQQAEQFVSWVRYPPDGVRGAIFGVAHDEYSGGSVADKVRNANEQTLTLVLIETVKGLANIDEILSVPGIDVAHLGHFDLSFSMGIPGEFDRPELQAAIDKIALASERYGKTAACLVPDVQTGIDWMNRGYRMISYSTDIGLLKSSLRLGITALRKHRCGFDGNAIARAEVLEDSPDNPL